MSNTQQAIANGETFWSIFFSKAKHFLLSEKTWIFLLSQFGAFVILWLAPKVGLSPDQIVDIVFVLLAKLGLESVGLTAAKAKIDADVSAAQVQGSAIKEAARIGAASAATGIPGTSDEVIAKQKAEQQLAVALNELANLKEAAKAAATPNPS